LFDSYLSGDSLSTAAKKAGITAFHAGIGRMLRNTRYLGDDYYPAIIDPNMFTAAKAERIRRAEKLGRIYEPNEETMVVYPTAFHHICLYLVLKFLFMNNITSQYPYIGINHAAVKLF